MGAVTARPGAGGGWPGPGGPTAAADAGPSGGGACSGPACTRARRMLRPGPRPGSELETSGFGVRERHAHRALSH
jgi:hypothetical protein